MSERSGDWRTGAGLTRFPEDNDVIGIAKNAGRWILSETQRQQLQFVEIAVGDYGYEHPDAQGEAVVWRDPRNGTSYILRVPYETPGSI